MNQFATRERGDEPGQAYTSNGGQKDRIGHRLQSRSPLEISGQSEDLSQLLRPGAVFGPADCLDLG
jgi:hypothetical protein